MVSRNKNQFLSDGVAVLTVSGKETGISAIQGSPETET